MAYPNKNLNVVKSLFKKNDIDNNNKQKEEIKHCFFNKILDEVLIKIKYANTKGNTDIILNIPEKRIGFPNYDYKELLVYIINKLRELNFYIRLLENYNIYVSWLDDDKIKKTKEINKFIEKEKRLTNKFN